jgi:DNA repair protein RecN (Recombination protein N)
VRGEEIGARLTRDLKPLGFQRAQIAFAVETDSSPDPEFRSDGLDRVEILFTANPGEPSRPLQRIVSGGELSRVMLALKVELQARDRIGVLLFDEVDAGIGGVVAQAVGERLLALSRHYQVICVTHLPMIAALANRHVRVTKHATGGRTVARVEPVEGAARIDELARMLAGSRISETTRRQARELLGAGTLESGAR